MFNKDKWPNANNHWINTLSFQFFTSIFGESEIAIRLLNVVSFFFFAYFYFDISKEIENLYLRFASFAFVVFNPYFLDFFSTARGYGLSIAGVFGAIYFISKFLDSNKQKHLIISLFLMLYAVLSLFSTVIFLPSILAATAFYFLAMDKGRIDFKKHSNFIITSVVGSIIILALIYIPITALSKNEEFKWGAQDLITGFKTLAANSAYSQKYVPNEYFVVGFLSCMLVYGYFKFVEFIKSSTAIATRKYLFVNCVSLIFVIIIMLAARYLWNSYYPEDRKTTIFLPFISFIIFSGLDLSKSTYKKYIGIILSLIIMLHFIKSYSKGSVREWWFDSNTKKLYHQVNSFKEKDTLTVGSHWMFYPTLSFYAMTTKNNKLKIADYNKDIDTSKVYDYFILFDGDKHLLESKYDFVFKEENGVTLMKKKQ